MKNSIFIILILCLVIIFAVIAQGEVDKCKRESYYYKELYLNCKNQ